MIRFNIWEGDAPNPHKMRAMFKASRITGFDGMHIVKTFEVVTQEEAEAVFDQYCEDMHGGPRPC